MSDAVDVVVLGAGPAGLSTALWCTSLGLSVQVLERSARVGGQLHQIAHDIDNVPGVLPVEGEALAETLGTQVARAGVAVAFDPAVALDRGALRVTAPGLGRVFAPRAVVIATGVRRRTLGVPGEDHWKALGVDYNMGRDLGRFDGGRVLVVGGGDDAFEHALRLSERAAQVTLVHRSDRFTARPALLHPVLEGGRVTLRPHHRVTSLGGDTRLRRAVLAGPHGDTTMELDAVLVCIGPTPNSEGFGVATDRAGYVRVDRGLATSRAGVYAVGDVCCPEAPTVATAFGHGATVAKLLCAAFSSTGEALRPTELVRAVDTLRVEGLTLPARIGVYPRERTRRQTLGFSLAFEISAETAARRDLVRDTVDYAAALETITEVLSRQHFQLIETVAETVAEALLQRFACAGVRVRVHKPGVPQRGATASVEVSRRAPSALGTTAPPFRSPP